MKRCRAILFSLFAACSAFSGVVVDGVLSEPLSGQAFLSVSNFVAALAAHSAYWPPNATASSWFTYTTNANEITITVYNIAGGTDVVIPDYINGWPVTTIGVQAFEESGITSIGGAGNVVTAGDYAFYGCTLLTSVSLPQVQTVGDGAFYYCTSLTSIYFDNNAPTIRTDIFAGITTNQVKIYVTNPTATGWGATFGDMPVVRLPLHADKIFQAGELVATTGHVEQVKELHSDSYTNLIWRSVYSNGWHWMIAYTNTPGGGAE